MAVRTVEAIESGSTVVRITRPLRRAIERREVQIRIARRVLRQPAVFHFSGDADDGEPRILRIRGAELDALADRVLSGQKRRTTFSLTMTAGLSGVLSASLKPGRRGSESASVSKNCGADAMHVRARDRLRVCRAIALCGVEHRRAAAAERHVAGEADRRDTGHRAHAIDQLARREHEWRRRWRGLAGRWRRRGWRRLARNADGQRQHARRIEARIDRRQLLHRANHQAGADEQDDRQRHFGDDQRRAEPLRSDAARSRAPIP